jgi:predicted transcriptional regulator
VIIIIESMKLYEIRDYLNAKLVCGEELLNDELDRAFASDLMSDVLTLNSNKFLLLTGLCNVQTIRTAEMADLNYLVLCRGKKASEEMLELAHENEMIIFETDLSMFSTAGILYEKGMRGMF